MNILETYLNYLEELSRWKKEVPNLSNQSIQKLKDTKVAKTSDEFRKGVNTGTKNITKKSNAIFNKGIPIGQSGKHHNRPSILHKGKTIVNSPYSLKGGSDAKIKTDIISAVEAVTGLAVNKIQVFEMKR